MPRATSRSCVLLCPFRSTEITTCPRHIYDTFLLGSALQQNIARVLKAQLSLMWLPSYCKTNGIRWTQSEFFIEGSKGQVQFHYEPLIIPQHVGHATTPPSRGIQKIQYISLNISIPSTCIG